MSVASKKCFWLFTGGRDCVFKTKHRIWVPKTNKNAFVKEIQHVYLFSLSFRNSPSCVQIKSSDYWHDSSAKLKYLHSYECIFNPVLFITSFYGSHFGSRENVPVSHQNSQTSIEIGADISIFFGPSVLHWHIVQ